MFALKKENEHLNYEDKNQQAIMKILTVNSYKNTGI